MEFEYFGGVEESSSVKVLLQGMSMWSTFSTLKDTVSTLVSELNEVDQTTGDSPHASTQPEEPMSDDVDTLQQQLQLQIATNDQLKETFQKLLSDQDVNPIHFTLTPSDTSVLG
jgi:ribosomal protein L16 Arg81 hydroxylase